MIANQPSLFGWVSRFLILLTLAGILLAVVVVEEIEGYGWTLPIFADWHQASGNEFTGNATALTFGAATAPVAFDILARNAARYAPLGETVKVFLRRVNALQRKHLMPFHTYLSVIALALGMLHLGLSSCLANPFPEWGLILCGILVGTGLLFKWSRLPKTFRKGLYQFHSSLLVTGILLTVLFVGHSLMSTD